VNGIQRHFYKMVNHGSNKRGSSKEFVGKKYLKRRGSSVLDWP